MSLFGLFIVSLFCYYISKEEKGPHAGSGVPNGLKRLFSSYSLLLEVRPNAMSYAYYNPNPTGRSVGDCPVWAISKALEQSWEETYTGLALEAISGTADSLDGVSATARELGITPQAVNEIYRRYACYVSVPVAVLPMPFLYLWCYRITETSDGIKNLKENRQYFLLFD